MLQCQLFVFGPGSPLLQTHIYLLRLKKPKFFGKIWNFDFHSEVSLGRVPILNPFKFVQIECNCLLMPINCLVFFIQPYTYNSDQNCFCTKVIFKYFKHMKQKISEKVKRYIYCILFLVDELNKVETNNEIF